jgi:glutaredoxin
MTVKNLPLTGNHVFGRDTCPFTSRARHDLEKAKIPFTYHNILEDDRIKDEMHERVQAELGPVSRITVPQIWLDGKYIGGSDDLRKKMGIGDDDTPPFCPI